MRMVDIIEKKARAESLSYDEIAFAVGGLVRDEVPDYQMSALLMAIRLNGMDDRETADMTRVMMDSGDVIDLSDLPGVKVDKHSTGGVGDTTTLVVAPLVAACGGTVAKMSGRGLSFTGGTLDKLESFPGLCVEQSIDSFKRIVRETGVAVIGQSDNLVPADKKIYSLRDVTATVDSIPLIAASIMSKKLAAGTDAIVLDVKTGSGAFMRTVEEAQRLGKLMVALGNQLGRRVVAVLTDMNQPLGLAVGNALEAREAIQLLAGQIPAGDPLYEVCMLLGVQMLRLSGLADSDEAAKTMLGTALHSGAGLEKLRAMITAEGGDASYASPERMDALCKVKRLVPVYPKEGGFVASICAEDIGLAAQVLGAGRAAKTDAIDPAVGLVMNVRLGDAVAVDKPLCTLYVNDETNLHAAIEHIQKAVTISAQRPTPIPMVYDVIRDEAI